VTAPNRLASAPPAAGGRVLATPIVSRRCAPGCDDFVETFDFQ
jgi:hypothetical protein